MPVNPVYEARDMLAGVRSKVLASGEAWGTFLTCAARNHKYPFQDQLLIYAYRPHATACADLPLWNARFSRYIKYKTKSIRLLNEDGRSVRHVFDITDTRPGFGHEFDEPPYVWQVTPDDVQDVSARLRETHGVEGALAEQLNGIAGTLTQGEGNLLQNSLAWYLAVRCGLEPPEFDLDGIRALGQDEMMALGREVNRRARPVLDEVERVVRANNERRRRTPDAAQF